jgi:hypothetical protein
MHRIATGLVVAAMVLAACGGSSKSSSTGGSGSTASGGSGGSPTTAGGSSSDSGGSSNISTANIKVSYTESGTGTTGNTTITFAQNGKGKVSFSSQDPTDTTTPLTTIYVDGTNLVECEGTGTKASCTQVPAAEAALGSTVTVAFSALASVVTSIGGGDKSSETIAGRDAQCWKFKAQTVIGKLATNPIFKNSDVKVSDYDANDTESICLDKKTGFPLKFTGTKKGAAENQLTAIAVSDPTDADFTPPATPAPAPSDTIPPGLSTTAP